MPVLIAGNLRACGSGAYVYHLVVESLSIRIDFATAIRVSVDGLKEMDSATEITKVREEKVRLGMQLKTLQGHLLQVGCVVWRRMPTYACTAVFFHRQHRGGVGSTCTKKLVFFSGHCDCTNALVWC